MHELSGTIIAGVVEAIPGRGGLPVVRVSNGLAECEVYAHGAHVSSFKPAGHDEALWMSPTSRFEHGAPIRGGIPVCFPWFGPHRTRKDLPLHGFVRDRPWNLSFAAGLADGRTMLRFGVADDDRSRGIWPYPFRIELCVTVGRELELELLVENAGDDPFRYEDCLHTYLRVLDVERIELRGLEGTSYIDRVHGDRRGVQDGSLRLNGETVNAYMRSPNRCDLIDPGMRRTISVAHRGFSSTVVWNPGETAAAANPEIGGAWRGFACVESANCLDAPILLPPGASHRSRAVITIEDQR